MKVINLIIKPTSECNLRCKYCYHANTNYVCGTIDKEKLKRLFDIASNEYETIKITWHGGEPMLLGRNFYEDLFKYQRELQKKKNVTFQNAMQTNGTLIDWLWCLFFNKYKIQPGISFDGPTNDNFREKSNLVMKGINTLKFFKIKVGCLAVINKYNIDQVTLYKEMKKYANSLKFNPVFSEEGNPEFEIDLSEYIKTSIQLFDYWLYDLEGIPLDPYSTYVSKVLGLPYSSCVNSSCLGRWLDIDSKGVIRTCGQCQDNQFVLGNIDDLEKISDVFNSENFNNLLLKAINRREICKNTCPYFLDCQGGCLFKAQIENGIEKNNGFSCKAFKSIYGYIKNKIIELLKNNVSLDSLNPEVKKIITSALSQNPKHIQGLING